MLTLPFPNLKFPPIYVLCNFLFATCLLVAVYKLRSFARGDGLIPIFREIVAKCVVWNAIITVKFDDIYMVSMLVIRLS